MQTSEVLIGVSVFLAILVILQLWRAWSLAGTYIKENGQEVVISVLADQVSGKQVLTLTDGAILYVLGGLNFDNSMDIIRDKQTAGKLNIAYISGDVSLVFGDLSQKIVRKQ